MPEAVSIGLQIGRELEDAREVGLVEPLSEIAMRVPPHLTAVEAAYYTYGPQQAQQAFAQAEGYVRPFTPPPLYDVHGIVQQAFDDLR